jgi:hypothetical protein
MIRKPDLVYQTPPGYQDEHYVYCFDAVQAGLVAGRDYLNLRIPTFLDADFILRKIDGIGTVLNNQAGAGIAGRIQVNDFKRVAISSDPIYSLSAVGTAAIPGPFPILPERMYPKGSEISFDLYNYQPANYVGAGVGDITPAPQLLFYGVKRSVRTSEPERSMYRLTPYVYTLPILFNWGLTTAGPVILGLDAAPRQFYVEVRNWDFELYGFHAVGGAFGGLPAAQAKMQLYDKDGRARYSQAIFQDWVDYQQLLPNWGAPVLAGNAIVPPMLYPVTSQIKIDMQSYYWTTDPAFPYGVTLYFFGAQRMPLI